MTLRFSPYTAAQTLGEDDMLFVVYSTLLMATQPPGVNKANKPLQGIQVQGDNLAGDLQGVFDYWSYLKS